MKKLLTICCASIIPLFALHTTETKENPPQLEAVSLDVPAPVVPSTKDRVPTIKHTKKQRLKQQKQRKAVADRNQAIATEAKEKCFSCLFNNYVQPLYRIKSIGAGGKTLTFEDETIWEISSSYASTARQWVPGSYVVIVPNTSWFSSYTYRLENLSDNHNSVQANLSEGPFMKYANFITDVDYIANRVRLTNGSLWSLQENMRNWTTGHAILIGENRGWFGWRSGNILININLNTYLSANTLN